MANFWANSIHSNLLFYRFPRPNYRSTGVSTSTKPHLMQSSLTLTRLLSRPAHFYLVMAPSHIHPQQSCQRLYSKNPRVWAGMSRKIHHLNLPLPTVCQSTSPQVVYRGPCTLSTPLRTTIRQALCYGQQVCPRQDCAPHFALQIIHYNYTLLMISRHTT